MNSSARAIYIQVGVCVCVCACLSLHSYVHVCVPVLIKCSVAFVRLSVFFGLHFEVPASNDRFAPLGIMQLNISRNCLSRLLFMIKWHKLLNTAAKMKCKVLAKQLFQIVLVKFKKKINPICAIVCGI